MPSALFYVLTSLGFREDLTLEARLPLSGVLGNSEPTTQSGKHAAYFTVRQLVRRSVGSSLL
jgi:hypothetical protein